MVVYWVLFAFFAAGSIVARNTGRAASVSRLPVLVGAILICLVVGLRYEVGVDWGGYLYMFSFTKNADLGRALSIGDPGYQLLCWLIQRVGLRFWAVDLVCAAIFSWGLYRFARTQPDPWLVFAVAIPYLVVVVAIGYTRQGVAIGFILAGLAAMERGSSIVRFAAYVAAATLFHRTAVFVLPLMTLSMRRRKLVNALAALVCSLFLYNLFLADSMDSLYKNYVVAQYSSQGALIRVVMNLVPALIFFLGRQRLGFSPINEGIWRYFALASLMMTALFFVSPSSTAIDRLALYLIPIQTAVLPRVKFLFRDELQGKFVILAYCALVLFVWLNFAVHARYWLPYHVYPFFGSPNEWVTKRS